MSNNIQIELSTTNVYHFLNGYYGGVHHVVRNLILYSRNPAIKNHVIYVIEKERFPEWEHLSIGSGCSEYIFRYSHHENIYHVYNRLAKKIPGDAVLIAHDWFELGMVAAIGMCNRVVYFLHGNYDYYFSLLDTHKKDIDTVLCISHSSFDQISGNRFNADQVFHFKFPVAPVPFTCKDFSKLKVAVIAENLTDPNKGVSSIREINQSMVLKAIPVEWHLVGNGFTQESLKMWWGNMNNLPIYHGYLTQDLLIDFFAGTNIFILPSLNEGVPVSLVEAMKAGLVPVIANWAANVSQLVVDRETGFVLQDSSVSSYASAFASIYGNHHQSQQISVNASKIANIQFDPFLQVDEFESHLLQASEPKIRSKRKVYGSRLDNEIIPNKITIILRKLKSLCALH